MKKFNADHLAGKVRLIFIDACKGHQKDSGMVQVDSRGGTTYRATPRIECLGCFLHAPRLRFTGDKG